jgi:neutral ceramidase
MPVRRLAVIALACALTLLAAAGTAGAATPTLRAGAGRADITPPTGYFMMGWVRSDAKTIGQHTRLYARVIVLERGERKVALVAEDLNGIFGGMLKAAADLDRDLGYSEQNVLDSASHTHAAPGGFANFDTYNTTFMTLHTPADFNITGQIDPQLYGFMVRRLALAIRRADADLAPAVAGWGKTQILGLTANRSLEAHLANFGISEPPGSGRTSQDPGGYADTIDPDVNVLRVDKLVHGQRVPIGIWSTFADHGTVNKSTFVYYNADHHGSATRVVEDSLGAESARTLRALRARRRNRRGRLTGVPARQEVVNVYGNTDEGDISAGLTRSGPADADMVGRVEATAMLRAWRAAGRSLSTTPTLDERWTRVCFCGQEVPGGAVDSKPVIGLPLLTGSEEGRGPLYDTTGTAFEGTVSPVDLGAQGDKVQVPVDSSATTPHAVPLVALRIGDRAIVSVPGEMTAEMGRRVRSAVLAAVAPGGIHAVVIAGLANEYLSYFTTPQEYERQHYEGGSTLFGRFASNLLQAGLTDLAGRLARGEPAPGATAFDPTNGVPVTDDPYSTGAASATAATQPTDVQRLDRPAFSWHGAPRGFDRPLDSAFVRIVRLVGGRATKVDSDLGLDVLWKVDADGLYQAEWEVPLGTPPGDYAFVVTGNRYRIQSAHFHVAASTAPVVTAANTGGGGVAVTLDYPASTPEVDLTYRPAHADGGSVTFTVNGHSRTVRRAQGTRFVVAAPAGATVSVPPGAARDRFGNSNHNELTAHA